MHDIFKFEESARFLYTCHNFEFQNALGLKNRLRSRTFVTILMITYVLETRLRTCIQHVVFCIHKLNAKP